ncbi:Ferredoxin [Enterobacteriaceae bacterium bta3-1]|nr:Ferredoxin [Enterobacteriaceae bacterium bta3-1]
MLAVDDAASIQPESSTAVPTTPTITLTLSGARLDYIHSKGSLLETLEHHKVQVEYQCRSGYCGSCRCKLTKGQVVYRQKPLAFINEGEILPCCCHPIDDIEVEL